MHVLFTTGVEQMSNLLASSDARRAMLAKCIMQVLRTAQSDLNPGSDQWWDASLVNDLGLDSLDVLELVSEIETQFEIEIPDELINHETIRSPRSVWMMIEPLTDTRQA